MAWVSVATNPAKKKRGGKKKAAPRKAAGSFKKKAGRRKRNPISAGFKRDLGSTLQVAAIEAGGGLLANAAVGYLTFIPEEYRTGYWRQGMVAVVGLLGGALLESNTTGKTRRMVRDAVRGSLVTSMYDAGRQAIKDNFTSIPLDGAMGARMPLARRLNARMPLAERLPAGGSPANVSTPRSLAGPADLAPPPGVPGRQWGGMRQTSNANQHHY